MSYSQRKDSTDLCISVVGERREEVLEFDEDVHNRDVDRISLSSSKSRESLASDASRSTMSSVEHRPRSSTGISKSVDRGHFLRPKTLAIQTGFSKIWRKDRSRDNHQERMDLSGTSCPGPSTMSSVVRTKSERKSVPMIRCDFVSAPSTPSSGNGAWMKKQHWVSSEIIPEIDTRKQRSGSHLSLNVGSGNLSGEKSHGSGSYSRSPKLISRFLRSSFAKILSIKGGNEADDDFSHSETVEEHLDSDRNISPEVRVCLDDTPQTPSTLAYIEETKLSGLPVIPFAYPTCVIVEKMNSKTREKVRCDSGDSSSPEPPRVPSGPLYDFDEGLLLDPVAHSPLEDLVDMALRELHEEEALCGSVGSASSSFDLFNSQNKVRRPNNLTNTAKLPVAVKLNDSESISDFLMDDELNLSDPTKSSWRREVLPIPQGPRTTPNVRGGPYLEMSSGNVSPKYPRSKAVPIGNNFAVGHPSSMR